MAITTTKDPFTEQTRKAISQAIPIAIETDRADASLCSLSFQSTVHPNRHVWIDTDDEGLYIDLEDWNSDAEWDNSVAHISSDSIAKAVDTISSWLSGHSLK